MDRQGRIKMVLDLLDKDPGDLFLNFALGLEYRELGKMTEAQGQLEKVLALDGDYVPAFYQMGKLFEAQAKISEALFYFKQGLEKARIQKNNKALNEFSEAIFMLED
jgi:tetratricopeptide (TPR) repeat protein